MAVPWQTFTARFLSSDIEGEFHPDGSSYVTAEIETPLVWAATGQIVLPITKSRWTTAGVADFELPLPEQGGFTAGAGAEPITVWGFRFYAQPTRSRPITSGSDTYVDIPSGTVAGAVVPIGNLMNVGAWPHSVTIVNPPPIGGTGTYVPVLVSGNSGYWSPA